MLLGVPTWVAAAPARRELCACAENGSELLRGTGPVGRGSGQWWGFNQHLQLPHVPASHGVPGYTAACPYRAIHSVLAESVTLSGVTGGTQVGTRAVLEPDGAQHTRRMALPGFLSPAALWPVAPPVSKQFSQEIFQEAGKINNIGAAASGWGGRGGGQGAATTLGPCCSRAQGCCSHSPALVPSLLGLAMGPPPLGTLEDVPLCWPRVGGLPRSPWAL